MRNMANLNGIDIIFSEYVPKTRKVRNFPENRQRSKRCRKKMIKRFGGEYHTEPAIFMIAGQAHVHPFYRDYFDKRKETP